MKGVIVFLSGQVFVGLLKGFGGGWGPRNPEKPVRKIGPPLSEDPLIYCGVSGSLCLTVEVMDLWTVFHEHYSLLVQSSDVGRCISTDHRFAYNDCSICRSNHFYEVLNTYPKEFF